MKIKVITIGCQCGSGGHTVGKLVAERLGVPFYMSSRDTMPLADQINAYQTDYIKEIAEQGSCVIVGRSADYILSDREDTLNVFIYGDLEDRMARIVSEHGVPAKEAEEHVPERDKKRSKYYKYITDRVWGLAANYDICLNIAKYREEYTHEAVYDQCR